MGPFFVYQDFEEGMENEPQGRECSGRIGSRHRE